MRLDDSMSGKGRLALLDFGLVARLGQGDMDAIVGAIVHLANRDYPSLVDDFIGLGILPKDCDRSLVVSGVQWGVGWACEPPCDSHTHTRDSSEQPTTLPTFSDNKSRCP